MIVGVEDQNYLKISTVTYRLLLFFKKAATFNRSSEERMQEKAFLKLLGKQIADLRKKHNLTQEQLGDLCEMERSAIGRLEGGTENITASTLLKLSKAMGIPVKKFFDFD